jgi:hypothetical protein
MIENDEAVAALAKYGSYRKAAAALGIPRTTFQRAVRRAAVRGEVGGPPIPEIAKPPDGFVIRRNSGAYDENGKLTQQWIESGQGNADGYEIPEGHTVKGESTLLDANGNVIVKWIKTKEGAVSVAGLITALEEAFAKYDGSSGAIEAPEHTDASLLTVYPIADLHFGMYAYGKETGSDYDTAIATQIAKSTVATLVSQSMPSEHAVVLVLGDYFHQNDQKNATPGSGHQLDVDGRWSKVYYDGATLLLEIIKLVATKHKYVEVKILPGNHDEDAAVTLTVAMSLFFSGNERITVNRKPGVTWYRKFGACLMGAHHGHTQKPEVMAMAMAVDRSIDWGTTSFRTMYFGHIHHKTAKEIMGILVESFASPAAKDSYNHSHGYRAMRSMVAITHHAELGEVARHTVAIFDNKRIDA